MIHSVTARGVDEALAAWGVHMAAIGRSPGTVDEYLSYLRRFLADRAPYSVTLDDIEEWIAANPQWSAASRRVAANALASFYRWALTRGFIESDPTANLEHAHTRRPTPKPTPDDVLARGIANATGDDRWLLRLAASTGLRRAELAALHSSAVEHHPDGFWLRIVGKGGQERLVPVSDELAGWIRSRRGWVFPSSRVGGRHELPASIGKRIARLLGGWSAHTLRHYFATVTYQATGDLYATQRLLGHASPVTTQGYVMESPTRLRHAAEAAWVA